MSYTSDILIQENGLVSTIPVTCIKLENEKISYDSEQLIIENGVITDRKPFVGTTDLFVSAGFINCHVHWLMDAGTGGFDNLISDIAGKPEQITEQAIACAQSTLQLGITFACDKGPPGYCGIPVYQGMLNALSRGELLTEFIYSPWAMMCEGGFGYPYGRSISSKKDMEIALLELESSGARVIKFIPESPFASAEKSYHFTFSDEAFQFARNFARTRNIVFAVHAKGKQSLDHCLEISADCVEHGVTATAEQLLEFQKRNMFLGPTLDGLKCRLEFSEKTGKQRESSLYDWEQVCRMVKTATSLNNGKPFTHMLFASDAGSFATPHASLRELYLLRKMGFSPASIFTMATINGAYCLKQKDKGSIEKGKRADLIFWTKNPIELTLQEWQNLETYIAGVTLNGTLVWRK